MAADKTDIVLCTKNRLPLLKRTLEYIFERTETPYNLHVIDDASIEGNAEYLTELRQEGRLTSLITRRKSLPIGDNWNTAAHLAQSSILVFTDDDVLCPKLDPDWLSRGLAEMARYRKLGLLALEVPSALHAIKVIRREGPLTLCNRTGAHLAFIRRDLMRSIVIPPVGESLEGVAIRARSQRLDMAWSRAVWARGYAVAYLTGVYSQHIGSQSERLGQDLSRRSVEPVNPDTLEPPDRYKSRAE